MKVYKLGKSILDDIKEIEVENHLSFDGKNVDSDGEIMYENTHFLSHEQALDKQQKELSAGIESAQSIIEKLKKDLSFWESKKDSYYIKCVKISNLKQ